MTQGYEIKQVSQRPLRMKLDKSATIAFDTGELTPELTMKLVELNGTLGTLIYVPEKATTPELQKIETEYEGKTPSQRLYNVLFVLYKQQGAKEDFQNYYRRYIETIIENIKSKLDPNI